MFPLYFSEYEWCLNHHYIKDVFTALFVIIQRIYKKDDQRFYGCQSYTQGSNLVLGISYIDSYE